MNKPNNKYSSLESKCLQALEKERQADYTRHIEKSTNFVKSLLGETEDSECYYDSEKDSWFICGLEWKCFTTPGYYAPNKLPCLGLWNKDGSNRYSHAYSLADIGALINKRKRDEEGYVESDSFGRQLMGMITTKKKNQSSWFNRLFG